MPATSALVIDMIKVPTHDLTRQMVFVKSPERADTYQVLVRQLSTSATAKHWKRWPVAGASLDNTPESWLAEYVTMHQSRDFAMGSAFVVEVTDAEWTELTSDATPRALMIRIDRARDSIGASMFTAEPRFGGSIPSGLTIQLMAEVEAWRNDPTPSFAPSGRARTPRVRPEVPNPTDIPVVVIPTPTDGTVVKPGDKLVLSDGTPYIARKIATDLSDIEMLRRARRESAYALLSSLPGTGKTRACQAAFGDDLITMLGTADTEVSDFVGTYVPTGKAGEFRWVDGPLVRAMDAGKPLLIDEAFLIDPRTLSIVYSAIDGRRELNVTANPARGTVSAKDGFYVVFAANPNVPGARVSEALLSRCALQIAFTTDFAAMETLGVPRTFVTAARNLDTKRRNDEISTSPQARECLTFLRMTEMFGERVALRNAVASAPEQDRAIIADVLSRSFGFEVTELTTE